MASFASLPLELVDQIIGHAIQNDAFRLERNLQNYSAVHSLFVGPCRSRLFRSPMLETRRQARRLGELVRTDCKIAGHLRELRVVGDEREWRLEELGDVGEWCGRLTKLSLTAVVFDTGSFASCKLTAGHCSKSALTIFLPQ
jgi:hypothetical protein